MPRLLALLAAAALPAAAQSGPAASSGIDGPSAAAATSQADAAPSQPPLPPPPATPKRPVFDTYHGVRVEDDYRWLESSGDPEVRAWSAAQNRRSRAFLDALPGHAAVQARIAELVKSSSVSYSGLVDRRGTLFALKRDPKLQQPVLVTLRSADDPASERVLVDPNALDAKGGIAIDFFVPSLDGARVAVSLSKGGSESGDLHLYDVASAKPLGDVISRVNGGTAGGSAAWNQDGSGIYYTRYPRPGERPAAELGFWQQLWFHQVGKPERGDRYEMGKGLPRIAEIAVSASEDGRWLLADVKNGDGGEHAFYLRAQRRPGWRRISTFADWAVDGSFGRDGNLYLLSRQGALRGRILRTPLASPDLARAKVVVPEREGSVTELLATGSRLYVTEIAGGPSRLRVYDLAGRPLGDVPTLDVSTVAGLTRLAGTDDILYYDTSYLVPGAWYRLDASARAPRRTALVQTSIADFSDCEVVRDFAVSKDGTRVPMSIIRRKGTALDGTNPTILYAYGGYAVSEVPRFAASRRVWLERGGVYAVANIRGGGEYGEQWHRDGMLLLKQNDYDDFYAAARRLVETGYTSPRRLAIVGGSNGGLLMGAALTQHPEAYRAVASFVGVYDMLRVENTPNGAFNVTEYGSVKDPAQFAALYAYSPLHHVADGTAYPAVLLITGENDPRVDPWHSRKFAARLQAATSSGLPVLLRTSTSSGHGIGSALDEVIGEYADEYAFLLHELGVPPAAGGPRHAGP